LILAILKLERKRIFMARFKAFIHRKGVNPSFRCYGIDALSAMAQGLFCTLLVGTILNTLGQQFSISFLTKTVASIGTTQYTVGGLASAMSGPGIAVAIGFALGLLAVSPAAVDSSHVRVRPLFLNPGVVWSSTSSTFGSSVSTILTVAVLSL
jgi:uncharacterized membrane protein